MLRYEQNSPIKPLLYNDSSSPSKTRNSNKIVVNDMVRSIRLFMKLPEFPGGSAGEYYRLFPINQSYSSKLRNSVIVPKVNKLIFSGILIKCNKNSKCK